MMLEGDHQRKWKEDEPRESRLVFIGRELPEQAIRDGFRKLHRHVMKEFDPGEAPSIASMTDRVRPVPLGMAVTVGAFPRRHAPYFVGAEENVAVVGDDGEVSQTIACMAAPSCARSPTASAIVMGGDDGKLVALDAKGEVIDARDRCRSGAGSTTSRCIPMARWRGRPARPPSSAAAKGEEKSFDVPSTVGGLAFAPKGLRLAVAHYNGVTLWFPNMAAKPEFLEWAGSHLGVTFSPDNKFLVTAMHEPAMHGWRLADNRHMRMSGYPGRVRSMSWSAGGKGLATSGADTVIVWPFASKDGPMGKEPAMLAPLQARVSVGRLPSEAGHHGGRLQRRHRADGADRGRRRDPGAPERRRAGLGAGLERQGHASLRIRGPKTATRGLLAL